MPEFYMIFIQKIFVPFFGEGATALPPSSPVSYTPICSCMVGLRACTKSGVWWLYNTGSSKIVLKYFTPCKPFRIHRRRSSVNMGEDIFVPFFHSQQKINV